MCRAHSSKNADVTQRVEWSRVGPGMLRHICFRDKESQNELVILLRCMDDLDSRSFTTFLKCIHAVKV